MGAGRKLVVALFAAAFFISVLPQNAGAEDNQNSDLQMILDGDSIKRNYFEGETISISSSLQNGENTIITENDPSCGFKIKVTNENFDTMYDSGFLCREQTQEIQLSPFESHELGTIIWDFSLSDDSFIPRGEYTIDIIHTKTGTNTYIKVNFYENIAPNQYLDLEIDISSIEGEGAFSNDKLVLLTLSNPTDENIIVHPNICDMIIEINEAKGLLENCFSNSQMLHPLESMLLGNHIIYQSTLNEGINEVKAYTVGKTLTDSTEVLIGEISETGNHLSDDLRYTVKQNQRGQNEKSEMLISLDIHNPNIELEALEFSAGCPVNANVYNNQGELVSTIVGDCLNEDYTEILDYGNSLTLEIGSVSLVDDYGCSIDTGRYSVVVFGNALPHPVLSDFLHISENYESNCANNITNYEISHYEMDDHIQATMQYVLQDEILPIERDCLGYIEMASNNGERVVSETFCDYTVGNYFSSNNWNGVDSPKLTFSAKFDKPSIENGETEIYLNYKLTVGISYIKRDLFSIYDNNQPLALEEINIEGKWTAANYGELTCWMISSANSAYILHDSPGETNWRPKMEWNGEYGAVVSQDDSTECSKFSLPVIEITKIYSETEPVVYVVNENLETNDGIFDDVDVVAVSVVAVTSSSILLSMLFIVSNTESLRIPATTAGLWLLGLIGKTQETSEGKFQRGRLIGYLTANPGCHFRALMAALQMSNGQITHHLRLLENQELVWRINDGRFVRYYPLNNSLYPGMNPDDLPIPPLSPDPKSLQGKILTLLDDEHQFGQFPTQSELANKLAKSQQLISHHLRTLQKYGLVEKRKMGIKNRYKLTKEAIFLLETDLEYTKIKG